MLHADQSSYLLLQCLGKRATQAQRLIHALHSEIMHIRRVSEEALVRQMRLTWWHEKLESYAAGEPLPQHPLLQAMIEHALPAAALQAIIKAAQPLVAEQSCTLPDWQHYFTAFYAAQYPIKDNATISALAEMHAAFMALKEAVSGLQRPALWVDDALKQTYALSLDHYGSEPFLQASIQMIQALTAECDASITNGRTKKHPHIKALCYIAQHYTAQLRAQSYDVLTQPPPRAPSMLGYRLWRLFKR